MINRDTDKIWNFKNQLSGVITVPFNIAFCSFYIYKYMGSSALVGLVIYALQILVRRWQHNRKVVFEKQMNKLYDERS